MLRVYNKHDIEAMLGPQDGYERLMDALFGAPDMPKIESARDLFNAIRSGQFRVAIPTTVKEGIDAAIKELDEREQAVVSDFFGINGDPMDLKTIGENFGLTIGRVLTRERVRQIKEKALRKLRYPSRSDKFTSGFFSTWQAVRRTLADKEELLQAKEVIVKDLEKQTERCLSAMADVKKVVDDLYDDRTALGDERLRILKLNTPVAELNLSVRMVNCFKAQNIEKIGDFACRTEGELLKLRNFGRRNLIELSNILQDNGLTFGMSASKYGYTPTIRP